MNDASPIRAEVDAGAAEAAVHGRVASVLREESRGTGTEVSAGVRGTTGNAQAGDALEKQVGGDHYKSLAIQPVEFIVKNSIPFLEANAIKYLVRHNNKGGAADIRKAIHYCELLLSLQYGEKA